MKIRALVPWVAVACFGLSPAVMAQGTAGAPTKVAVIDIRAAIVSTAEGKSAAAELQSQFAPQSTAIDGIRKQIDDIEKKLQSGANTLSDDEKVRLQRQDELLQHTLQRRTDEYQEQVTAAQNEIVDRIGRKMIDVVDRYSRENNIALVVDGSTTSTTVLYKSASLDITLDIVKLYDQQYPVKAAATTPAKPPASTPPVKKPGGTN